MVKIEAFKAGNFVKQSDYKSFAPELINISYAWDNSSLTRLAEQAALVIGQLDAYSDLVPNIDHFIRMYVTKEATVSSRIEGTQTNMEEALLNEKDINPEQRNDWREVNNYIVAMNNALGSLDKLPISTRLLCQAHADLMQGVRGKHKQPGEFRGSQNWIGGQNPGNAAFVPPVWQQVNPLMGDLENFLHNRDTGLTQIMKIALAHYQFETIHPFLDGNGRLGRLMITLYLVDQKILHKPVLYLSDFFDKNRVYYYDNLTRVRTHNDLLNWLLFFMQGVIETGQSSIRSLKEILELKKDCEEKRIYAMGKKVALAKKLLDHLFIQPVMDAEQVSKATGLSLVSSYKMIEDFRTQNILKEMTGNKRNRIFVFEEYFSIFKK
ncbi:MAG: Fic family protein [Bacteroidetes bacterium]|nr:Fic family protein [Bacteroidota bacterium]